MVGGLGSGSLPLPPLNPALPLVRRALYRGPLHNLFLLCSTWIVAIITGERFLVVSRPIHARFSMIRSTNVDAECDQ